MESKKAQGLSITTIILIILGVVVLVVLIIGFTKGWDSVKGFFTGGASVDEYVAQCNIACTTESVYAWCIQDRGDGETCRTLADDEEDDAKIVSCVALETKCKPKSCEDYIVTPAVEASAPGITPVVVAKAAVKGTSCDRKDGEKCKEGEAISGTWTDLPNGFCCKSACAA